MAEILTEYNPTKSEQKLLEVLMNPANRMKSATDVCQIAGISRETYYAAFYKDMSLKVVKAAVAPVINAFVREAQRGSFQHGKILLEMADMYAEKTKREVTGADGGPIQAEVVNVERPQLSREEWEKRHGLDAASRAATSGD